MNPGKWSLRSMMPRSKLPAHAHSVIHAGTVTGMQMRSWPPPGAREELRKWQHLGVDPAIYMRHHAITRKMLKIIRISRILSYRTGYRYRYVSGQTWKSMTYWVVLPYRRIGDGMSEGQRCRGLDNYLSWKSRSATCSSYSRQILENIRGIFGNTPPRYVEIWQWIIIPTLAFGSLFSRPVVVVVVLICKYSRVLSRV